MKRKKKSGVRKSTECVVGRKEDVSCWLLAIDPDERTGDQNIELALRFPTLKEAERTAEKHLATVFLIVDETTGPATLEEVA